MVAEYGRDTASTYLLCHELREPQGEDPTLSIVCVCVVVVVAAAAAVAAVVVGV